MGSSNSNDNLNIAKGIPLSSLNDYIKTGADDKTINYSEIIEETSVFPEIRSTYSTYFKDLEETNSDVTISPYELIKKKSPVDNITFTNYDETDSIIAESILAKYSGFKKNELPAVLETEKKINIPVKEISRSEEPEAEETTDIAEISNSDSKYDEVGYLLKNIDKERDYVENPGEFDISIIDKTLLNREIDSPADENIMKDTENLGVDKSEIYNSIEEEINSKRAKKKISLSSIKNIKSGITAPLMAAVIPAMLLIISIPVMTYYFHRESAASLDDNLKKDTSILSRIAKQREEEARRLKLELEEEMLRIANERERTEFIIYEELNKRRAEIENTFTRKKQELESRKLPPEEFNRLSRALEREKETALYEAETEKENKLEEQNKLIALKNLEIEQAKMKIQNAIDNKEFELENVRSALSEKIREKDTERAEITRRLDELRLKNEKIVDFNTKVHQLINSAIDHFKNSNTSAGIARLNSVVQFYDTQKDFALSEPALTQRMNSDIFFISTITDLVNSTRNSVYYNTEIIETLNRLKTMNELYNSAEIFYNSGRYNDALQRYEAVLKSFENISTAHQRVLSIEKEIQNAKALRTYNEAVKTMQEGRHQEALILLAAVAKDTPDSDYTAQAVENIAKLSGLIRQESSSVNDENAHRVIFENAQRLKNENRLQEALGEFEKIIINFPLSSFTKSAYENTVILRNTIADSRIAGLEDSIKNKFNESYQQFRKSYREGNLSEARSHYFTALNSAFNIYAGNSINDFLNFENEYIKSLLSSSESQYSQISEKLLEEVRIKIENKYAEIQKNNEEDFSRRISELIERNTSEKNQIIKEYESRILDIKSSESALELKKEYEKIIAEKEKEISLLKSEQSGVSAVELEKLEKIYAGKLEEKNREIETLKQTAMSLNTSTDSKVVELQKAYEEKQAELERERTIIHELQNELLKSYKSESEIQEKAEQLAVEKNEKLFTELNEIRNKYAVLEKQSARARLNEAQLRRQITEEVKRDYEKTTEMEKQRLQSEFNAELNKIKNTAAVQNESEFERREREAEKTKQSSSKLTARVIETIDTSITFQFFSDELIKELNTGDTASIIRFSNGKETEIAKIRVTYTSQYSLFGRGRIIEINRGEKVLLTDVIKKIGTAND